jgi:hypothetical protein
MEGGRERRKKEGDKEGGEGEKGGKSWSRRGGVGREEMEKRRKEREGEGEGKGRKGDEARLRRL